MEYNLVQTTTRAPFNRYYLCDEHVGPFIDCFKDQFGHGAVFICGPRYNEIGELLRPGCVGLMAKLCGMLYVHEVEQRDATIKVLQDANSTLEDRKSVV